MLSADTNKSSGVFTCQTCNSLFTCLDYYQKHRQQHAEAEGVKLLTCAHCTYVSDNVFHYNWHIMSHTSSPPHRCDVCAPKNFNTNSTGCGGTVTNVNSTVNCSASNGLDVNNDPHQTLNERISSTIVFADGKRRSIATETSDDLILLSQIYSPASPNASTTSPTYQAIRCENICSTDTDTLPMLNEDNNSSDDNATIIQDNDSDFEDQNADDEETEEDDDETDVELSCEMNNNNDENCDIDPTTPLQQQQEVFYETQEVGSNVEGDEEDEEGQENEDPNQFADFGPNQESFNSHQQQQMVSNGLEEITNEICSANNFNEELPAKYEDETDKNDCDNVQPLPSQQSSTDVYDFNSDEDLDQPSLQQLSVSKSSSDSGPQTPLNSASLANIQLQSLINTSSQGLPTMAPTHGSNQPPQSHLQSFLTHPMSANFLFPGAGAAAAPFGPQNANPTIFNPGTFTANGPIRLVSIQPFQHPNNQPLQSNFIPNSQTNGSASNSTLNLPSGTRRNQTTKKSSKKSADSKNGLTNNSPISNASTGGISNGTITTTLIPNEYKPTKGIGKGNRKPRISFISIVDGITVGADGIRRKFHCSHCGNGKSFKTKSHLQRHMLTHTGEKPYECQECGAKFNQSSSLRNHIIAIHTKKFPHTCTVCGKGFLMPAVLQKHIQTTGHQSAITVLAPSSQFTSTSFKSSNDSNMPSSGFHPLPFPNSVDLHFQQNKSFDDGIINQDNLNFTIKEEAVSSDDDDDEDDDDDDDDEDEEDEEDYPANHLVLNYDSNHQQHLLGHPAFSHLSHPHLATTSNSVSTSGPQSISSQSKLFFVLANSTAS